MINNEILSDIKSYKNWEHIEHIDKGWSDDTKYLIVDKKGNKSVLRLSSIENSMKKRAEYNFVEMLSNLNINLSKPVEFGFCGNKKYVYSILTWIDGEEASIRIPILPDEKQYKLGVKAGKSLRLIHENIPALCSISWEAVYIDKINKVVDFYNKCGYKYKNAEKVIQFVKENMKYLKKRPITYQHGDFHLGNMVVTSDDDLGIIDFNRYSIGDPWEEYDRFVFTWKESRIFANGQLHGYFNGDVPDEFFHLMALYNARNLIASIPWSIPFGEKDLRIAIENADMVMNEYDEFNSYIPNWYKSEYEFNKKALFY